MPGAGCHHPAHPCTTSTTCRSWYFQFTVNTKGYDCVVAAGDLGYDIYLGADTVDDYTNSLNYLQNEANKNGWNLATCGLKYFYVCEALSTIFPCYPPPSPPSPPPLPPSPPSPPMPPTCTQLLAPPLQPPGRVQCQLPALSARPSVLRPLPTAQARRPPMRRSSATPPASSATRTWTRPCRRPTPARTAPARAATWSPTGRRRSSCS
jgi:hypothetical protein